MENGPPRYIFDATTQTQRAYSLYFPAHSSSRCIKTTDDGWPTRGRDSCCLISVNSVAPVLENPLLTLQTGDEFVAKIKDITNSKLPTCLSHVTNARLFQQWQKIIATCADESLETARFRSIAPFSYILAFSDACFSSRYLYWRNPFLPACCLIRSRILLILLSSPYEERKESTGRER